MAGADYWRCDVCGGKAFYDAPLNYDDHTHMRDDGVLLPLGCGDMAALCEDCAKTHEVVVKPRHSGETE